MPILYSITFDFVQTTALIFHSMNLSGVSVITMIGYGDIVPRTKWGKIGVIIYACLGIPVYILYFTNIGKVFARILKWLYTKAYRYEYMSMAYSMQYAWIEAREGTN